MSSDASPVGFGGSSRYIWSLGYPEAPGERVSGGRDGCGEPGGGVVILVSSMS